MLRNSRKVEPQTPGNGVICEAAASRNHYPMRLMPLPRKRAELEAKIQMRRLPVHPLLLLLCALFAGCGAIAQQTPGTLTVRSAAVAANGAAARLELGLDCELSGPMQDALDHGIPITLRIDVRAGRWPRTLAAATQRIELRYFPLSRRYQLRESEPNDVRSFATPAYLIAALGSLRVGLPSAFANLPATTPLQVSVAIDPAALPGALRLPALFEPAWRLAAKDYAWIAAAR
jgi:hypothetical protein